MSGNTLQPDREPRSLGRSLKSIGKKLTRSSTSRENKRDVSSQAGSSTDVRTGALGRPYKTWAVQTPKASNNELDSVSGYVDTITENDAIAGASRDFEPASDLSDDIADVIDNNKIGLHETGETYYLPDEERERLVTSDSIRQTLGHVTTAVVQWILREASKTFVITILAMSGASKRREAMDAFFSHGFNDGCLPVVKHLPMLCKYDWRLAKRTGCGDHCDSQRSRECENIHDYQLDCFHHKFWTASAFQNFYEKQWRLLLQNFRAEIFEYDAIEDDRILPFLPSTAAGMRGTGNFAVVQPARMLTKFQDAFENDGETIDIAIKTLKPVNEKGFDIDKEWRREVAAHKALDKLDSEHLVQAIAAYRHRGQYCLLFEWADGGNLRTYWNNTNYPGLSSELISEYLDQLQGLTHALNTMHHTSHARSRSISQPSTASSAASVSSGSPHLRRNTSSAPETLLNDTEEADAIAEDGTGRVQPPRITFQHVSEPPELDFENVDGEPLTLQRRNTRGDENWRHGDVKPDNILRFAHGSSKLGILKLADLGRAKQHFLATRKRAVREWDQWRTKPYEPPDLYMQHDDNGMSRLFDVWSLGCVFFESIVWMLYGKQWLQDFEKNTGSANQDETPFWIRHGDSAAISPIVEKCMSHIMNNDPECNGERPSALKDLLKLVSDKMLVIDLPKDTDIYTQKRRANTKTILEDIKNIINKSKDPNYLFTGSDRSEVEAPPKPQRVVPSAQPRGKYGDALDIPGASRHVKSMTERLNTYSNVPENRWKYGNDESFARRLYQQNANLYKAEFLDTDDQVLCRFCQTPNILNSDVWISRKVQDLRSKCSLCAILIARTRAAGLSQTDPVSLSMNETSLTIKSAEGVVNHNLRLRLCRSLENAPMATQPALFIPLGRPKLPESGSEANYLLIRSWLDDCNSGHGEKGLDCMSSRSQKYLPKRLLDVGSDADEYSRIVETKSLRQAGDVQYLAFSHPWGQPTAQNPHFTTTNDNIRDHMQRISDTEFPQNFLDAVVVARRLGLRYLWIDALCILQRTKNHPGDFQDEAGFMQDIFSSAFCVLAASSATGMNSGFLHSGDRTPRQQRQAAELITSASNDSVFVCESPDDFQQDVIESPLNARAWVLQERALARRTIFFTNNQIYWECSGGFRCESMSKLANSDAAFLGDSNFPDYVLEKTKGAQIYLFQRLYADFCRLGLSHNTDKPFAISGLEQRLTERFKDTSGAGVFGKHKGRCLLWRRSDEVQRLQRIDFENANPGTHKPPSWSFMAHSGQIAYIDVPGHTVAWEKLDLHLTGHAKTSWLYAEEPLKFYAHALDFEVMALSDSDQCLVVYDDPAVARKQDKCVIIGKKGDLLRYILVVRPETLTGKDKPCYERVGAGYLPFGWIKGKSIAIEIV